MAIRDNATPPMGRPCGEQLIHIGTKVVNRSRNLRGIAAYANSHVIHQISVGEQKNGTGILSIFFENGAEFHTEFASYDVMMSHWLRNRRGMYGAPLEVNGASRGKLSFTNPAVLPAR